VELCILLQKRTPVAAAGRHTLRPYITSVSVRQCSNRARQNAINWTSKKRHVASMSGHRPTDCCTSAWHLVRLIDRRLPRPDSQFGSSSRHRVRVRSVQTDRLSSVAWLNRSVSRAHSISLSVSIGSAARSIARRMLPVNLHGSSVTYLMPRLKLSVLKPLGTRQLSEETSHCTVYG